jgi:hypothetical protein
MQNKEFVTEFQRIVEQDLATQIPIGMKRINLEGFKIYDDVTKKVDELKSILGAGTSDLIKCPSAIVTTDKQRNYRSNNEVVVSDIVTFNHKGPGILRVSSDPNWSTWGMTYSKEMSQQEILQHFTNPVLVAAIIKDLTEQNRRKMLKIFSDVVTVVPELVVLAEMRTKFATNIKVAITKDEAPIDIVIPSNKLKDYDEREELSEVMHMIPIKVNVIVFGGERNYRRSDYPPDSSECATLTLFGKWEENDSNFLQELKLTNNADLLILMQFPDKLKEMIRFALTDIQNTRTEMDKHFDSINTKLAPYTLCRILKEG